MFKSLIVIQLFFTFNVVLAHGDAHEEPSSAKWKQYAQKHVCFFGLPETAVSNHTLL